MSIAVQMQCLVASPPAPVGARERQGESPGGGRAGLAAAARPVRRGARYFGVFAVLIMTASAFGPALGAVECQIPVDSLPWCLWFGQDDITLNLINVAAPVVVVVRIDATWMPSSAPLCSDGVEIGIVEAGMLNVLVMGLRQDTSLELVSSGTVSVSVENLAGGAVPVPGDAHVFGWVEGPEYGQDCLALAVTPGDRREMDFASESPLTFVATAGDDITEYRILQGEQTILLDPLTDLLMLMSPTRTHFSIDIRAAVDPPENPPLDYTGVDFHITATSGGDPSKCSVVSTLTQLSSTDAEPNPPGAPYGVRLSVSDPRDSSEAGVYKEYTLFVQNQGIQPDVYDLTSCLPAEGWKGVFEAENIHVNAGETGLVTFYVYGDSDGDGLSDYDEMNGYFLYSSYPQSATIKQDPSMTAARVYTSATLTGILGTNGYFRLTVVGNALNAREGGEQVTLSGLNSYGLGTALLFRIYDPYNSLLFKAQAQSYSYEAVLVEDRMAFRCSYSFEPVTLPSGQFKVVVTAEDSSFKYMPGLEIALDDIRVEKKGADLLRPDCDGDGLGDGYERDAGLSCLLGDTDSDKIWDGAEAGYWMGKRSCPEGLALELATIRDADGDGLPDGSEINPSLYGTDPAFADTDADGLGDGREVACGANPRMADTDGDSLGDAVEVLVYGSDPCRKNSDGDDLSDGTEVIVFCSDPSLMDTDNDGLNDGLEAGLGTNPLLADTDGDGMGDGWEVANYLDPLDPGDGGADSDGDGLPNVEECAAGSNPWVQDSDGDLLDDRVEVQVHRTSPVVRDTDGDGLYDGQEVGIPVPSDGGLPSITDPTNPDTDGDTLPDGWIEGWALNPATGMYDSNGFKNGLPDPGEFEDGDLDGQVDPGAWHAGMGPGETDPNRPDTDGDTAGDGWEIRHGFDPLDGTDALTRDSDNDGLINAVEFQHGTDPFNPDTDGDGIRDGDELDLAETDGVENLYITDPTDPDTDDDSLEDGFGSAGGDPGEMSLGTNPTDRDTDGDGIDDGVEYFDLYRYDRIEAEDFSCVQNARLRQFGSTMWVGFMNQGTATMRSSAQDYSTIRAALANEYRLYITGTSTVKLTGVDMTDPDVAAREQAAVQEGIKNALKVGLNDLYNVPNTFTLLKVRKNVYFDNAAPDFEDHPVDPYEHPRYINWWEQQVDYRLSASEFVITLDLVYDRFDDAYEAAGGQGRVDQVELNMDYFVVERRSLDPADPDTDGDGLGDGEEVMEYGTYPLNTDPDEDGISDGYELSSSTDPEFRDTDYDGLRDRVELGYGDENTDDRTAYDTSDARNQDQDHDQDDSTQTDPTKMDTDGDFLPDGWHDGWSTDHVPGTDWRFGNDVTKENCQKTALEFEDYNCNGAIDAGETDPFSSDSDDDLIPDYWEVYWQSEGAPVDPLDHDDAGSDSDLDGLTNLEEYTVDTNPGTPNTDYTVNSDDRLLDGTEAKVVFRTDVEKGARCFDHYGEKDAADIYEWIYYVDSRNTPREYGYEAKYIDPDADFQGSPLTLGSIKILELRDGTTITYNRNAGKLFVWMPGSDITDIDFDEVCEGAVHVFSAQSASSPGQAATSDRPRVAYKDAELYRTSPFSPDSDGDNLKDGVERSWSCDTDGDGQINAMDPDSDDDGVNDWSERFAVMLYNGLNELWDVDRDEKDNMLDPDSDGDGLADGLEYNHGIDSDGDGYPNFLDWDSDGDGVPDGWVKFWVCIALSQTSCVYEYPSDNDPDREIGEGEDLDCDGALDGGTETDPLDADTDDDGLTDGFEVLSHDQPLTGETVPYQFGELTSYNGHGATNRLDPDCDNDGLLDGQEVVGWTLTVEKFAGPSPTRGSYTVHSDPNDQDGDTDNDGLPDFQEYRSADPTKPDTDGDGLGDDDEDADRDGQRDCDETSPLYVDTDHDYLWDGVETAQGARTEELNPDTDGDGLLDGEEDTDYDGALDATETDPSAPDSDQDGLGDFTEHRLVDFSGYEFDEDQDGTYNWRDPDSDNDGLPDGVEIRWNTNPDGDFCPRCGLILINVFDSNSNNDNKNDGAHIWVGYRTNAIDTNLDGKLELGWGTWMAFNIGAINGNPDQQLTYYTWAGPVAANQVPKNQQYPVGQTHEGYPIYYTWDFVTAVPVAFYIGYSAGTYMKYTSGGVPPANEWVSAMPVLPYCIRNQERWGGTDPAATWADSDCDGLFDFLEDIFPMGGGNGIYDPAADFSDLKDYDTDDDGVYDLLDNGCLQGVGQLDPKNPDTDGDGLQDGTEMGFTRCYGERGYSTGNLYFNVGGTDPDRFVPDADTRTKTNPTVRDCDGDGLPDGWVDGWAYDPVLKTWGRYNAPDNQPQLYEGEEIPTFVQATNKYWGNGRVDGGETNPRDPDSDDDGIPDGWERWFGYNPLSYPDAFSDPDHDFLINLDEYAAGTRPDLWDTDGDTMPDGYEVLHGLNPLARVDALLDHDKDKLTNINEYQVGMPKWYSFKASGVYWYGTLPDDPDTDGDGVPDGTEHKVGANGWSNDIDQDGILNVYDDDSDGDGLSDYIEWNGEWEISYEDALGNLAVEYVQSDWSKADTDGDYLDDYREYTEQTNPRKVDTDGDRFKDCEEIFEKTQSVARIDTDPLRVEHVPPTVLSPGLVKVSCYPVNSGKKNEYYEVWANVKARDNVDIDYVMFYLMEGRDKNIGHYIEKAMGGSWDTKQITRLSRPGTPRDPTERTVIATQVTSGTVFDISASLYKEGFTVVAYVYDMNKNVYITQGRGGYDIDGEWTVASACKWLGDVMGLPPDVTSAATGLLTGFLHGMDVCMDGFVESSWASTLPGMAMTLGEMLMGSNQDFSEDKIQAPTDDMGYYAVALNPSLDISPDIWEQFRKDSWLDSQSANPYDPETEAGEYDKFNGWYCPGQIAGYITMTVLMDWGTSGGVDIDASEGQRAAQKAGRAIESASRRAGTRAFREGVELTKDVGRRGISKSLGFVSRSFEKGELTDSMASSAKVWLISGSGKAAIRGVGPAKAAQAARIGAQKGFILDDDAMTGLGRLLGNTKSSKALADIEGSGIPRAQKALGIIGRSDPASRWTSKGFGKLNNMLGKSLPKAAMESELEGVISDAVRAGKNAERYINLLDEVGEKACDLWELFKDDFKDMIEALDRCDKLGRGNYEVKVIHKALPRRPLGGQPAPADPLVVLDIIAKDRTTGNRVVCDVESIRQAPASEQAWINNLRTKLDCYREALTYPGYEDIKEMRLTVPRNAVRSDGAFKYALETALGDETKDFAEHGIRFRWSYVP
jgi:hypothetical protein